MNDTPQNDAKGRIGHRILFWLACLALLVVVVCLVLSWSGRSAWDNYRRQWEARGERFDFASFVPKPVPDDQNFALVPIVASSYERILDKNGHKISPPNRNVVNRLELEIYGDYSLVQTPTNGSGSWTRGMTSDLKVWQNYYRALAARTNLFPIPPQPQSPAADVLLALSKYDSAIEELRRASRRPCSRFPLNYDTDRPYDIWLPHLAALKHCSQVLQLRAIAELQNNQSGKAMDDVKLMLCLTESIHSEPFLISHLVRIAMVNLTLQPVWEGLVEHKWSDAQLAELNQELARLDFLADYEFSMRGERACTIAMIDHLRRTRNYREFFGPFSDGLFDDSRPENPGEQVAGVAFHLVPSSVFYQNELAIARMHQQLFLPIVDVERRIASPETTRRAGDAIVKMREHWSPNNVFACMLLPAIPTTAKKYAYGQSSMDMARVAIALECYRLAHGEYPESLDALSPQFMEKIPHDIINGQPLHYRRTDGPPSQSFGAASGKFLLYSVGWNETDDGGVVGLSDTGRIDVEKGDWVWPGAVMGIQ
jgi:hypothetical protein